MVWYTEMLVGVMVMVVIRDKAKGRGGGYTQSPLARMGDPRMTEDRDDGRHSQTCAALCVRGTK